MIGQNKYTAILILRKENRHRKAKEFLITEISQIIFQGSIPVWCKPGAWGPLHQMQSTT